MAETTQKSSCSANEKKEGPLKNMVAPSEIKRALFSNVKEPIVFHNYLSSLESCSQNNDNRFWKCLEWDSKMWGKLFGGKELRFRLGRREDESVVLSSPQWETDCLKGNMSFEEFLKWCDGERNCVASNGEEVNVGGFWAYFDYFYMSELQENKEFEDMIDWGVFGFNGRGVKDSTLWIGTTGANTPCHIDTYGCNLVAQVMGKKRWTLFPKSQSQHLSPTRIPYEESSIYSQVGFPRPCLIAHPELCSTTPYVITLEPGDVLFVPGQWWHFVENLEFSISINTWLELPSDDNERVKEALVMYQVGSLCQGIESFDSISSIFNPNMMSAASMTSSDLLQLLTCKIFQGKEGSRNSASVRHLRNYSSGVSSEKSISPNKRHCQDENGRSDGSSSSERNHHLYSLNWDNATWCSKHGIERVPKYAFQDYVSSILHSNVKSEYEKSVHRLKSEEGLCSVGINQCRLGEESVNLERIKLLIDSFTDDRVIDLVKMIIDEKLKKMK